VEPQQTIKKEVSISGVGLHTGNKVNCVFKPSEAGSGIRFVRVDLPNRPVIPAEIYHVIDLAKRPRRTSVGIKSCEVHTIEHLLASLVGLKIDNITVEIDSDELPGLDGSALGFTKILNQAGREIQEGAFRKTYTVREPISIQDGDASVVVLPSDEFRVSYTLSHSHPLLNAQFATFALSNGVFEQQIAPARTFCTEKEGSQLREKGLGKGADYTNTLVVGEEGVIHNNLRFSDEFVRHKILDLIGDFCLLGMYLKGHVIAIKSGHQLNIGLIQRIRRQEMRERAAGVPSIKPRLINEQAPFDSHKIQRIIPHRDPFLFVDRIIEFKPNERAVGIKYVKKDDHYFKGHFPGHPVMPGVLIIEAMAQVCGVLTLSRPENLNKLAYFMSIERAKFRQTVLPGDELMIEVTVVRMKRRVTVMKGRALVKNKLVAEATLMFSVVETS
jgi:UDP-3-O-[3-hydroxymyristoyl] N-acetylglucosamine deacetylase / 3-hydroxyacyl-[acyl-carrier-protein] dehydratase